MSEPAARAAVLTNRLFEDIEPGDTASLERTLAARDIELFAAVSGDLNPTHVDADFSEDSGVRPTGHSLWGPVLLSGLLGTELPGPGTVYRSQTLEFQRAPLLGDTLTVTVEVKAKRPADRVVELACSGVDQLGRSVFSGIAEVVAPAERIERPAVRLPRVTLERDDGFRELMARAAPLPPVPAAVVHPCEATALAGAVEAARAGFIEPLLVGPPARIAAAAEDAGLDLAGLRIVESAHSHDSAARAVELVRTGEAEILMKGSLHTDELMGVVLSSTSGLRTERRVSHAFVMDIPSYRGLLIVTDAAINIAPDIEDKRDICQNAIDLAHTLGIERPKVAILSAVETVTPKLPSTLEAAALCKMAERGQITGAVLDGPLAMDNALSAEAARTKGIVSEVAGDADIFLAPDLDAGNILAKQLTFLAGADAAGVVLGARIPIVLTSRADNVRTRLASCAVAKLQAHARVREAVAELPQ
ncbi:MAG: bifunctional enoyl-CoA hydratase/phosphate acetyltransferase [Gammaproteobacteria bacterium]